MSSSDSDEEVYRPLSDDDDSDAGTETLAEMLERTRREQAAQREIEAEGTTDESQSSTVPPAPVEPPAEDGFVGPPGHVYANPRDTPYAGTAWRGDRNMFERINRDDLSKPKGTRPAGYIWNEELLGWRRTWRRRRCWTRPVSQLKRRLVSSLLARRAPRRPRSAQTFRTVHGSSTRSSSQRTATTFRSSGLACSRALSRARSTRVAARALS